MKKDNSSGKANKAQKIIGGGGGGSSLQIDGEDASRLVGDIVEKGFSDQPNNRPRGPSSAPLPTVLPFPVARHRSHGPHWNAMSDSSRRVADMDEDVGVDEEDEDLSGFSSVSDFANPVRRKQKKGLDFSKWRQLARDSDESVHSKMEGRMCIVEPKEQRQTREVAEAADKLLKHGATVNTKQFCGIPRDDDASAIEDNQMEVDMQMQRTSISNIAYGVTNHRNANVNEEEPVSLESQIDTENRDRLLRMSFSEIAEAQAEIMAKMRPELIQALRNRGRDKLKKQKASSSDATDIDKLGNLQVYKPQANISAVSDSGCSNDMMEAKFKHRGDSDTVPELSSRSSNVWDTWTRRVEGVREIRFSIDGDVVKSGFAQVPRTGNASGKIRYSTDNVSERDFLRTEGDPGAAGYSIKEAVALSRSVVPGQRALALHLIASILGRAQHNIQKNNVGCSLNAGMHGSIDWEAIWAFALGPEPELALSLRLALDDNHNSVVLACAKVIECVLSCDYNESYFDISEKTPILGNDVFTAPVFRSRPEIDVGFLRGGFWKYNTKPSNIVPSQEVSSEEGTEGEHTIKDDVVVAGQDVAAGLVRMGILERILYLLETDPSGLLEECLISILVAIARHSPACSAAIMNCQRLVQTVVDRFIAVDQTHINSSKIKSVTLLKVLAHAEKKNCIQFINNGNLQKTIWHLYRPVSSIDEWVQSGREACKLSSALLVEQLRLWKVCIQHGYSISYFSDLFPALCVWLNAPELDKLIERNVLREYAAITGEVCLVLEALTRTLPNFYLNINEQVRGSTVEAESWCWSYVGPIIDLGVEWTKMNNIPFLSKSRYQKTDDRESSDVQNSTVSSLLWLISSVLHMISGVLGAVIPQNNEILSSGRVPYLPDFVPKIGLAFAKNGFFSFSEVNDGNLAGGSSFLKSLCFWRVNGGEETSIASVSCLHGLVQVIVAIDKLIELANPEIRSSSSLSHHISREDKILADGMLQSARIELEYLLETFIELVNSEWQCVQSVEIFGRGGPAPGVGMGWGGSGGGFFSVTVLSAQVDARFLGYLLQICQIVSPGDTFVVEEKTSLPRINSALEACLIAGPRDRSAVERLFDVLFPVPVLRYLDSVICQFLHFKGFRPFSWKYDDGEYQQFSSVLAFHFRNRWLSVKKKTKAIAEASQKAAKKSRVSLETIDEEGGESDTVNRNQMSLVVEWAHQRLPLPTHWFLSPISTTHHGKKSDRPTAAADVVTGQDENLTSLEAVNAGLFFILGIEAMASFLSLSSCFVRQVTVVWKLHALSVTLLDSMAVLEEEKSRDVFETLQDLYGQYVDEPRGPVTGGKSSTELLNFQAEVHETYSTFIETLVEQLAAVSYGDVVFCRQVAIYLHRRVEARTRLAAWNALSSARALELLPPLEKCIAQADGYLEPVEDDERILEAYAKSWVSDALDRAATRKSAAFVLALHHLSCFIFESRMGDMVPLRNKIVKSLLRDCSRKQQHKSMMLSLIEYNKSSSTSSNSRSSEEDAMQRKRMCLLRDACEGNSSLVSQADKLEEALLSKIIIN